MSRRAWSMWAVLFLACGGAEQPASNEDAGVDAGTASVSLTAAVTPDPPKVGQNDVVLTAKDESQAAVAGCVLTATPWMPSMGHGSTQTPVVTEGANGAYTATPVTFTMPGAWELRVKGTCGAVNVEQTFSWSVGN